MGINLENIYLRFNRLTISQGEYFPKKSFYLSITNKRNWNINEDISLKVYVNETDNAIAPLSKLQAEALVLSSYSLTWNIPKTKLRIHGRLYFDVTKLVQRIIERPGWVYGNAIMFVIKDNTHTSDYLIEAFDFLDSINESVKLVGHYTKNEIYTWLTIQFNPNPVGARWKIGSGSWKLHGETEVVLKNSNASITYDNVTGYIRPIDEVLPIANDEIVIQRVYISAPALLSAETSINGDTITLTFDKDMSNPIGSESEFNVLDGGVPDIVTLAALDPLDAKKIILTLTNNISFASIVTIDYTA